MSLKALQHFALFGGSFNPLHRGHVALLRELCSLEEITQVLVIPARQSPFKQGAPTLPDALRWAMLRRVIPGFPRAALLDLELRRPAPSYTLETLHALESQYPRARFSLAMGEDALAGFSGWRQASTLLEQCALLVTRRNGGPSTGSAAQEVSALASLLPAPWAERTVARDAHTLCTTEGRVVLRLYSWKLPDCAASRILSQRDAQEVPEGARELLEAFWRATPVDSGAP